MQMIFFLGSLAMRKCPRNFLFEAKYIVIHPAFFVIFVNICLCLLGEKKICHFNNIKKIFRKYSENIHNIFWKYSENFRKYSENYRKFSENFRKYLGNFQKI